MCTDENGDVYQLDKDLMNLPEKNKHYSPHNCVFLPREINSGLGQLPRMRNLETKRKVFIDAFDKYFETLDEDALGKLIEVCGHNYGLDKFEVKTEETLKVRNKYDVLLSKIYNWEDNIDVSNFKFSDGEYSYKQTLKIHRYSTAKEAILARVGTRLLELETAAKDLESDKTSGLGNLNNWWRLGEVEKVLNAKLITHRNMVSDVETGKIKLPHYVLTWV